jgi:hypothetical protein
MLLIYLTSKDKRGVARREAERSTAVATSMGVTLPLLCAEGQVVHTVA